MFPWGLTRHTTGGHMVRIMITILVRRVVAVGRGIRAMTAHITTSYETHNGGDWWEDVGPDRRMEWVCCVLHVASIWTRLLHPRIKK